MILFKVYFILIHEVNACVQFTACSQDKLIRVDDRIYYPQDGRFFCMTVTTHTQQKDCYYLPSFTVEPSAYQKGAQ